MSLPKSGEPGGGAWPYPGHPNAMIVCSRCHLSRPANILDCKCLAEPVLSESIKKRLAHAMWKKGSGRD